MRRHAKAPSAGSTLGTGSSRGLFGRAFATRGGAGDGDGSGARAGRWSLVSLALAVCLCGALVVAPAAQAGKAAIAAFGAPSTLKGEGAGELNTPTSIAVNRTGAGGVNPGEVYIDDLGHNRIQEFSSGGEFVRAWGYDVVSSGEHNTGADNQQKVTVKATGGNFTLTVTTASSGGGLITTGSNQLTNVETNFGSFHVGDEITGTSIPAGTTIIAITGSTLTLSANATATRSVLNLAAKETTANISATAPASAVEAALESKEGVGDVTVTGGPGDATGTTPYEVTFSGGLLSHNKVAAMTATGVGLTGGSPSSSVAVATVVEGGGVEFCEAASSPEDTCTSGAAGTTVAGTFNQARGIAVDQTTGNVYVVSAGTKRIDVYTAKGIFEGAFGWNVNASSPEEKLQFCTASTGCKTGVTGEAAGQFSAITTAIAPAIDPTTGNFYLDDNVNRRIDEYHPVLNGAHEVTGASFVRAIGEDVVPTINEKQTVTVSGATGGSFTLAFNGQETKPTGTGNVTVGSKEITSFAATSGTFTAGDAISGEGIPAGATVTAINAGVLTISANATETKAGVTVTGSLPFNASATVTQNALRALSTVGTPNATVTGGPAGTTALTVEFSGALAGVDQPQMTANSAGLSGTTPTVTVATTRNGANGTGTGLEVCTESTTCKAGSTSGFALFSTNNPASIAIDSTGAIYAVNLQPSGNCSTSPNPCYVIKINASGTSAEQFAPTELTASSGTATGVSDVDVAVDPSNNHVIVSKKVATEGYKFLEFTSNGSLIESFPAGENGLSGGSNFQFQKGLAVGTGERLYFISSDKRAQILGPPPAPTASISPVTGISSTLATFNGSVKLAEPGPEGGFPTFANFEYSSNGFTWSKWPEGEEIPLGDGSGSGSSSNCAAENPEICNLSVPVTGLLPNTNYVVRLTASDGTPVTSATTTFATGSAAPTITGTVADEVTRTSAELTAKVNPNGQATTYHFEWGEGTSYGARIPAEFDAFVGSGSQPVKVTAKISGLESAKTYHFRLVASNESGKTIGPDQPFATLSGAGLPDNRGIELVSPPDKRPNGSVVAGPLEPNLYVQAAANGEAVAYPIFLGLPESTAGGSISYLARRGSMEWKTEQTSAPSFTGANHGFGIATSSVKYFSPNLNCGFLSSFNPLTSNTPAVDLERGVNNLYRINEDGSRTLVTAEAPNNPSLAEGGYIIAGASSDCSRVYFQSKYVFPSGGSSGVYEWDNGILRNAAELPNGASSGAPVLGGETDFRYGTRLRSVSSDGSRFIFTATSNEGGDSGKSAAFVRSGPATAGGTGDLTASSTQVTNVTASSGAFEVGQTVTGSGIPAGTKIVAVAAGELELSQQATATSSAVSLHASEVVDATLRRGGTTDSLGARFETASTDGRRVFFISNYGLASTSSSGPMNGSCAGGTSHLPAENVACDLYEYDVETGVLKDLSADTNPADTKGAVADGILDISSDGSYVYFAAMGQLVPGKGKTYNQNLAGAKSENIYLSHGGVLSYVATIPARDTGEIHTPPSLDTNLISYPEGWSARASANGQKLLFATSGNVTGYSSGGASEAYLYSAETETVTCISCRPDGQPSLAKSGNEVLPWVRQQGHDNFPRSMSEDGSRVFFQSPDILAPGAISGETFGNTNVYEWEGGQVYLLATEATLVDSSASGSDVFITTGKQLAPQDFDFARDLYDIRVNGGFPAPPTPPVPCEPALDQCQGAPTQPPAATSPGSASFSGTGNPPRKVTKPKKPHRKGHHKKQRHKKSHHKKSHHKKRPNRTASNDRGGAK